MPVQYEDVSAPRFRLEAVDGYDQISIPAQRSAWGLFLLIWLCGWTVGGYHAITSLFSATGPQAFLVFWLCGWALGEVFAATSLAWMIAGVERLRVIGQDLEVSYRLAGLSRTSLYRGRDIRNLAACMPITFGRRNQVPLPFLKTNKVGSIRFTYGARTVFLGDSLDEAEGQLIVDYLRRRLARSD